MTHEINPASATDHGRPEELPLLLTVDELARTLRISRTMAYEVVNRRDFPAVRIGRAIRVPRDALLRWLDAQTGADQTSANRSLDQILPVKRSRLSVRRSKVESRPRVDQARERHKENNLSDFIVTRNLNAEKENFELPCPRCGYSDEEGSVNE